MRDAVKSIRVMLQKIEIKSIEVKIPAFCPHCGADLRGTGPNELGEDDGTHPLTVWITTMGTQSARVGRPLAVGRSPDLDRDPGEFDPGDEPTFTTGVECGECLATLATAGGFCSPGGPSLADVPGLK